MEQSKIKYLFLIFIFYLGSFNGALSTLHAHELASVVIKELLERTQIDPKEISEVILGQVLAAGMNLMKHLSRILMWPLLFIFVMQKLHTRTHKMNFTYYKLYFLPIYSKSHTVLGVLNQQCVSLFYLPVFLPLLLLLCIPLVFFSSAFSSFLT